MKNKSAKSNSSAVVVDGKLVLTLPDAMTPVVWQMALEDAKSAALEVVEDKVNNIFSLMLRDPKGGNIQVAPFEERDKAVEALMLTSHALQQGHGKIRPMAAAVYHHATGPYEAITPVKQDTSNKLGAFLAIALIVILMFVWVLSIPQQADVSEAVQTQAGASGGVIASGVPVSADDFLSGQ